MTVLIRDCACFVVNCVYYNNFRKMSFFSKKSTELGVG